MWAGDGRAASVSAVTRGGATPLAPAPHPAEVDFYEQRRWCLNAYPTVAETRRRLEAELQALDDVPGDWRRDEVLANAFLLCCALADAVDDHLAGEAWDFSQAVAVVPGLGLPARLLGHAIALAGRWRASRLAGLRIWREAWGPACRRFLQSGLLVQAPEPGPLLVARAGLEALLGQRLDPDLLRRRCKAPAAFRNQDLSHHDILELTARFAAAFRDTRQPLTVVGLRSAGSYFAPLVHAALLARGYTDVEEVTLRPKRGATPWESEALDRCARREALAVVVDEPPDTGGTLARAMELLRRSQVPAERVVALLPIHPSRLDWRNGHESLPLAGLRRLVTLPPLDWHKQRLLDGAVEGRLRAYFRGRGYTECRLAPGPPVERFNRELERLSEQKFHTRLKRVYGVRLQAKDGRVESRYVLAKSVGWGWLGYHAFVASHALREFTPSLVGLREGILYSEWLPEARTPSLERGRDAVTRRLAAYVATRARELSLGEDPTPSLEAQSLKGIEMLASVLSRAYGWKPAAVLERARLRRLLSRKACPVPALIDGKMRVLEWLEDGATLWKADFEQHGMGKTELNVTDPAYDLAEAILHFRLSAAEQATLLQQYREGSGDGNVEERLLLHKLLAGSVAARAALDNLRDPRLRARHEEFNQAYIEANEFLTEETARACGSLLRPAEPPRWRAPLVVMDIDGVLDKQIFGFPSTTAAGVHALRLLHAHGATLALNTARPLREVQEYCRAYGMAGGVAEYGAVAWDALSGRARVLVGPSAREELRRLAEALRRVPGVFLNDRYEHSLRAYTFERGRTVPLPEPLAQGIASDLGLKLVTLRSTYVDTTAVALETDKGEGLLALLELAGISRDDTVAIGDSEPDLPMFSVASRSFAPAHISGRRVARLLGCQIAGRSYQPGLLSAARSICHPAGGDCPRCAPPGWPTGLFWDALRAADRRPLASLLRAVSSPRALLAFRR